MRKIIVSVSIGAVALLLAILVARSLWQARLALSVASLHAAADPGLRFTLHTLDTRPPDPALRILSAAGYRSAIEFEGDIYVAGRSALWRFDRNGSLKQTWHVGTELPPFALDKMAVRRGVGQPELWIGTEGGGALIYDGKELRQLLPETSAARKITALLPLADGRMILGANDGGVLATDGRRLDWLHPQFSKTKVSALAGDQDALWIGTRDDGLWLWRAGEATHFLGELPDPQVLSLAESDGMLWAGTPFGVAEFRNGAFVRPLAEGLFARSLQETNGTLLVGTMDEGIRRIPWKTHLAKAALTMPAHLSFDSSPAFATLGGETVAVTPTAIKRVSSGETILAAASPLADSHVSALMADDQGRLWIGYFDRGLDILDPRSERPPVHIEDEVLFCVNRIREDPERHTVAVGTANGLVLFDPSDHVQRVVDRKSGLLADHVTDLLFDRNAGSANRSLTVATPAGITFLEGNSSSSISAFQGLVNNHVYTLAGDGRRLLAGTLGGFSLLRDGRVGANVSSANSSLHQNWITAAAQDGKAFYIGTYGSGVVRVEQDNSLTTFREFAKRRIEINPNALALQNGSLYAGTAGRGLAVMRSGDLRWRFIEEKLPSLNVTAIAGTDTHLYVGTDNGLVEMRLEGARP